MNGTYRMDPVVAAAAPEILTLTLPPAALVAVTTEAAVMVEVVRTRAAVQRMAPQAAAVAV